MSPTLIAVLRAFHFVAGSFWLGTLLLNAGFLMPAVKASGPAGGQVMKQLVQAQRLPTYMNTAVIITLLTGAILFWLMSGKFNAAWMSSGTGIAYSLGSLTTIATALVGYFVNAPTAKKFGQLAAQAQSAGTPPSGTALAEMQRLQLRLYRATQLGALLLVIAASSMAVARYL